MYIGRDFAEGRGRLGPLRGNIDSRLARSSQVGCIEAGPSDRHAPGLPDYDCKLHSRLTADSCASTSPCRPMHVTSCCCDMLT